MEVMLTVLIMSMLLVSISQILNSARKTRDTIHNLTETTLAGPAILDRIERDIRGLVVFNRANDQALRIRDRTLSGIDADTIDFVTSVNSLVPEFDGANYMRADHSEVGYRLRPNPANDDFLELYRREAFGVDEEPFDGGRFTFMNDRIRGLSIQVYDEDGPDAEALDSWNSSDDEEFGLPARIEIELTLELTPRLTREQLKGIDVDKALVTYRRVIRFPPLLHLALEVQPVPIIPNITPPRLDTADAGEGLADDAADILGGGAEGSLGDGGGGRGGGGGGGGGASGSSGSAPPPDLGGLFGDG